MRSHKLFRALATLLPLLFAGTAFADGRWTVSLGVGESVSQLHGSAIEAAAYAQLHPLLGLGFETGTAFMQLKDERIIAYAVEPDGGAATHLASLTDGITRNRGLFMGPALRIGQQLYAVASGGIYQFSDNDGHWLATRWGGSAGIGLTGSSRFSPRAELRYRWAPDRETQPIVMPFVGPPYRMAPRDASAIVFTIGANFH